MNLVLFIINKGSYYGSIKEIYFKYPYAYSIITHLVLALLLFFFLSMFKVFHKSSIKSLFTVQKTIPYKSIVKIISIYFSLLIIESIFLRTFFYDKIYFSVLNGSFKILPALVILLLTILQVAFEEVLYRSYLLKGFFSLTKNKIIAVVITSILFSISHYGKQNPDDSVLLYLTEQFIFGAFLAIIAIQTNSLAYSIGIHAIHNIYIGVILGPHDTAIFDFSIDFDYSLQILFQLIKIVIISIVIYRVVLREKLNKASQE